MEVKRRSETNLKLVHSIAGRFRGRGVEYDDLFSAGCVGLVKAENGFEAERGLCFSTYAVPLIMGEIRKLFRDGCAIRVSRPLKELSIKANQIKSELSAEGKAPRISDIAERLCVTAEEAAEALAAGQPAISLTMNGYDGEDGDSQFDLPIESETAALIEHMALGQSLMKLEPDDRRLIVLRYYKNKTQQRTGELLGLSQVQVSRREKKILGELRGMMV